MRILVLTFYFTPDLSAGSFRSTAVVKELARALPGLQVDVLTTLPNRYKSFSSDAPEQETHAGVSVRRIPLPPHSSDVPGQARAFSVYAKCVLREISGRRYDLVFATSSRLMTAVLGALCARRTGARLYLDIRDLFCDTIGDVFPWTYSWLLKAVFMRLERKVVRSADKVNLVSRGFAEYFAQHHAGTTLSFVPNGVDPEFIIDPPDAPSRGDAASGAGRARTRVVYAGNIGEGQGLHNILPSLAERLAAQFDFRIIGDGGRRVQLATVLRAAQCSNVEILPPMSRSRLLEEYGRADILFLHLNDHEAFKKVLPSKLFEYAAIGKPVWAGVSGYAAQFIREEIDNAAVFPPCNADAAVQSLSQLSLSSSPRLEFVRRYAREGLMRQLAQDIVNVAESAPCKSS